MTNRPTRRQLRRRASQLRRDGYQPMMLVNSGSELPEAATTAIVRAIWRYRSELAPITVAALTATVAATLHHDHARTWPLLAVATLAITTAHAVPPPTWARKAWSVLDRPAERAYAAAIVNGI
jgi:S-DNA-T family DNA segregation ATPase FtsK/SpoIIIE